ncbi:hydrogenase 4 subunit B [Uliginosibacterium gangwonense]|uniref:hydrogenase 4 subunit B n=1 Tax=Uliginosibacterium gangwonense TaxID=392736 RepID=UPI00037C47BE|nr:hydrogenase 4 subunit B [Uliginosibacterium gangwonense]
MNSLELLLLSVLLYMGSALLSLLCSRVERTAINLCGIGGMAAGVAGLAASLPVLLSGHGMSANLGGPFAFAEFTVRLDPLAAFMVFVISLLATITSLYSLSYVREYEGRGAWAMGFFMNTFIAAMVALMVVDNAFYFLVFFEMMSLASYFLVVFDQHDEAVSAGFLYFLIAHAGSVLIMGAFFILYTCSGSMAFESFRQLHLSAPLASIVFLLAFFGFGAKAGIIPLHSWLPRAHPAAPSHGSALMSGVMVKVGVFGIIKVGIDLLGATSAWWGLVVLGFGAISAVLGVLYALAEKDAKRLLAYSSVENVGIILMGVGVGMIGIATGRPALGILGLLGALYHLINHAVFKGLLFLGAGSILFRTHTKDMEKLGGLGRLMPYTAAACLVGAMAISALPPLNGFVSEWFTYQSLFSMSLDGGFAFRLAGPVAVVMLAITGALAAMCFVKFYGLIFSGKARSEHAAHAHEAPAAMTWAMGLLALIAIALGLCAPLVAPIITRIASSLVGHGALAVAQGTVVFPGDPAQATLSTPLIAILLLAAPILAILIIGVFKGERLGRRHGGPAWACGYEQEDRMRVSADGFSKPVSHMFDALFRLRSALDPAPCLHASLQRVIAGATRVEPMWEDKVISPIVRVVQWIGTKVQWLQHGDFRIYCLYVVAALVVFLMIAVA